MKDKYKLNLLEFMESNGIYFLKLHEMYAVCIDVPKIGRLFIKEFLDAPTEYFFSEDNPLPMYKMPVFIGDLKAAYRLVSLLMSEDVEKITPKDLDLEALKSKVLNMDFV